MGGGGADPFGDVTRAYADIVSEPLPSRKIALAAGRGSPVGTARVSIMANESSGLVNDSKKTTAHSYVLPPLESKYDRALARHYSLNYPPSSPTDQDLYSSEWVRGNATAESQMSATQPFFRVKTPNCPWGVDRKAFFPSKSVVSHVRLAASRGRSHSSMDAYPPQKMVQQVIPGYTGHFTGLRSTIGKTYGHAGIMLGRMSPALLPLYRKEDVMHDEMGICRSGYPSFVRAANRWSRRPDTATRPLVKDPLCREAGSDIIKHLSNMLVERVPGKSSWPIRKALYDLRRVASSAASPLMTAAEVRTMFLCMKVEMHERDIQTILGIVALPGDNGLLRIETLCHMLEQKQHDHPLSPPSRPKIARFSQSMRIGTQASAYQG